MRSGNSKFGFWNSPEISPEVLLGQWLGIQTPSGGMYWIILDCILILTCLEPGHDWVISWCLKEWPYSRNIDGAHKFIQTRGARKRLSGFCVCSDRIVHGNTVWLGISIIVKNGCTSNIGKKNIIHIVNTINTRIITVFLIVLSINTKNSMCLYGYIYIYIHI